jgi:hypothetical protein
MRIQEALAWGDSLGVEPADLPGALRSELRRLEDLRAELIAAHRRLGEVPDAEVSRSLWRATSALGAAEARVHDAAVAVRRSA